MSNIDFTKSGSIKVDGLSHETELAALQMVERGIRQAGGVATIDVFEVEEPDNGVIIAWTYPKG